MRKKDIIDAIFYNSTYRKKDIEDIVNQVFDLIVQGLINDGKVVITNFGTFEKQNIPPYEGVHPVTGEKIKIDAHNRIRFVSSKKIKSLIK
ncbi:MAG: HU family DNA-binding protein [Bacilli bacterium]|jgi:DNA-binding protein HU-beta